MTDMRHLEFIDQVAKADVVFVDEKDRSYGGSWKRRGGVGAFMMLARKWDRLENMLGADSYDIFKMIEGQVSYERNNHKDRIGSDGTALAEVRDLRRYLLLVEAEMMARGVVPSEIAMEPKDTRSHLANQREFLGIRPNVQELDLGAEPVIMDGLVHQRGVPARAATDEDYAAARKPSALPERTVPRRETEHTVRRQVGDVAETRTTIERQFDQRTPEDGGQHCALAPHVVSGSGYAVRKDIDQGMFDLFWARRAPDVFVLEPHVQSHNIPRVLRDFYNMRGESWTLRPEKIPPDARDMFPVLSREKNMKEHGELPEWQRVLYTWIDDQTKYVLAEQNVPWAEGVEE
jgi:hypothetical protein